jgi:hypothetical protein
MKQMKNKFQKSIVFTLATALSISLFQFLGVGTPDALAASFEKEFSVGPGGAFSVSHARFFAAPAGVGVTAKVTFQREGNTDIPITIEIENPDGAVVASRNDTASLTAKTATLNASGSNKGCNPPWKVRVKSPNGQALPAKVFGKITFSFTDPGPVASTSSAFGVTQGNTLERDIADPAQPGALKITATWNSPVINSGGVDPAGLKLRFRLFRGTEPKGDDGFGYAHNALFGNANPKMTINYNVTAEDIAAGGNWKLKVTGSSGGDASDVKFTKTFTPRCQ